jgi:hypothetical protein
LTGSAAKHIFAFRRALPEGCRAEKMMEGCALEVKGLFRGVQPSTKAHDMQPTNRGLSAKKTRWLDQPCFDL